MYMVIKNTQLEERLSEVYELVLEALNVEGEHHKAWLLDQMVRVIVGEENYEAALAEYVEEVGEPWDVGSPA